MITDNSGETTWTYNNFGQVTAKTQTIGTIALTTAYAYDAAGRLTTMTLPSGKIVTYGYNGHLPESVTVDSTTILSGATYEPFGPVNGWTWGNSTSHSRSFDLRGLLDSQSMVTDTRTLTYDGVGRMITLDDARHDLGFDYDALGQLTDFTKSGSAPLPASQYFSYDGNGNRESITENGTPYSYTNVAYSNRLTSTTGPTAKSFTYDAAGNVTNDGIHSYAYDDRGRLVNVDSGSVTYMHNGQGQRVKKDDGSAVTLFVYDEPGQLIGEYDGSGNAIQETVWFNGAPVAVLIGSDEYYVHTDHLGTPRAITDGNTVIWRWESDPFGTTAAQEDPDGDLTDFTYKLRFPGQYYDQETGLHYNYFRDYDPAIGRYVQSDPIGVEGGLNTFAYAFLNPLLGFDPLGLETMTPQQWADFLNSLQLPSVGKDSVPERSRQLRDLDRAIAGAVPITAARQAALEGNRNACEILEAEVTIISAAYGMGAAGKAIANAGLNLSRTEAGRAVCLAFSLCNPKLDSAAGPSRIVVESTIDVVRDLRRIDRLKDAADAGKQVTTHLPQ
jgi:RHS repeat-associated protein